MFANADDRCICKNRLANEGMCQHEILGKGGYDRKWFLPKHMRRKQVSGSLNGWMPPVDAPFITEELIAEETDAFSADFDVMEEGNVDVMAVDGMHPSVPHIPPNPFESMKPLGMSRLKTLLSDAMNCYAKLGRDAQYEVSKSVLEIEEVMKKHRHASERQLEGGTVATVALPEKNSESIQEQASTGQGNSQGQTSGTGQTSYLSN